MSRVAEWFFGLGGIILIVGLVGLIVVATIYEHREWQEFAASHDCKLVRKTAARTVTTFGAKGEVHVGTVAGQKCYACNDGVEYCR